VTGTAQAARLVVLAGETGRPPLRRGEDNGPMTDDADELDAVAVELLALAPAEFTAARNARARAAPKAMAERITALRRPSVSAWAVDLLARDGLLREALDLAASLRAAQEDLDAPELSRLGRERRRLVAARAGQAAARAAERGVQVSSGEREEIEKTLNAAMIDPRAAAAVRTARLVRPIDADGLGGVDLEGAVDGSVDAPALAQPPDDLAERRAQRAAEKKAQQAERESAVAQRELSRIETERERARERVDRLGEHLAELRRGMERTEAEYTAARTALDDLSHAWTEADDAARAAARRARTARGASD